MKTNSPARIVVILISISALAGFGFFLLITADNDQSVDDSSAAPENNCCIDEACSNFNGDFVAGYNACVAGECDKCAGGATGSCDNDNQCDPGENDTNCASDCDTKGYSQFAKDVPCETLIGTTGNGQCNEGTGLKCVLCPGDVAQKDYTGVCTDQFTSQKIVLDNATLAEAYVGNESFQQEYCDPPGPADESADCEPIDSNADGKLTIVDLADFAIAYLSSCSTIYTDDSSYGVCGSVDVGADGVVNVVDLAYFASYYNKESCSPLLEINNPNSDFGRNDNGGGTTDESKNSLSKENVYDWETYTK